MRSSIIAGALVCLTAVGALGQDKQHQQAHDDESHIHSHRGPGPHFIDAFFTENAYVERKLRPDVAVATGDQGGRYAAELEVEWAVHRSASLIVHAPLLLHLSPAGGPDATGIGDLSLGAKVAVINDRSAFIFAVGADFQLPTGDHERGLGEEHAAAAPFLLTWLPFGAERRWLLQTAVHVDVPLKGDDDAHTELSTAISWTSPLGITPILEAVTEFSLEGGAASWAVAPEVGWEFAAAWEVGAAVRVPVSGPREEDVRLAVGFIRHFRLPR